MANKRGSAGHLLTIVSAWINGASERFWSKVEPLGECRVWTAATGSGGYGVFKLAPGVTVTAHRLSLIIATGEDRSGMETLHSCHNPRCVNPAHLRWGTRAENEADKAQVPFSRNTPAQGLAQ